MGRSLHQPTRGREGTRPRRRAECEWNEWTDSQRRTLSCEIEPPAGRHRASPLGHDTAMTHEQRLAGGMDPLDAPVRVGDTVRRAAGSSRAAVCNLLLHLESVGFDGAPRHLGTDDQGREVLTWIDGDVPLPPYPAWAMTDRALADLGGLVRRFYEATATFRGTTADWSTEWADPARRAAARRWPGPPGYHGPPVTTLAPNDFSQLDLSIGGSSSVMAASTASRGQGSSA